ncbi:MAG: hypothetical protein K5697_03775 [Lachnospiraceae bacterium]|nr:hypothetical protein [Lachnospiraceae bacterium]
MNYNLNCKLNCLTNIRLATEEDKRYNIDKWAMLFKAKTWEEIKMLAAQDVNLDAAATTIYQLSEDERIQLECEAREDYLLRQQEIIDTLNEQNRTISKQKQTITKQEKTITEQKRKIAELEALLASK